MAIPIPGKGNASALDQSLHQDEVATGVLLGTKHRVDHGAGGAVHGQQQGALRALLIQLPVVADVNLHQHPQPAEAASPCCATARLCSGLALPGRVHIMTLLCESDRVSIAPLPTKYLSDKTSQLAAVVPSPDGWVGEASEDGRPRGQFINSRLPFKVCHFGRIPAALGRA